VAVSITAESTMIHIQGTVSVVAFLDSSDGAVQVDLQDGRADGQEVGESEPHACQCLHPTRVWTPARPHHLHEHRAGQRWFVASGGFSA
jgi:hypothetical protein